MAPSRRSVILAACSELFEHRGYYGTSLRMIARASGMTASLLQKYFPTKESIIAAFVEQAIDEIDAFVAILRADSATIDDPHELLRHVGEALVAMLDKKRGFFMTWMMCPELIEPYRDSLPHFLTAGHKTLAQALSKQTGLSFEVAFLRVRIFFGAIFTAVIFYDHLGFPGTREEAMSERLERVVESVLCEPSWKEESLALM
ncbi:MAG TPA: TetR/AcrR family transcriptional regulator [Candidatus Baltobacteraceae bacterium]|nr:TetR/AcrR family transcriptional regulator [Candidatus Baltobacteraceae bacterium]